jgi:hypothetical protein
MRFVGEHAPKNDREWYYFSKKAKRTESMSKSTKSVRNPLDKLPPVMI